MVDRVVRTAMLWLVVGSIGSACGLVLDFDPRTQVRQARDGGLPDTAPAGAVDALAVGDTILADTGTSAFDASDAQSDASLDALANLSDVSIEAHDASLDALPDGKGDALDGADARDARVDASWRCDWTSLSVGAPRPITTLGSTDDADIDPFLDPMDYRRLYFVSTRPGVSPVATGADGDVWLSTRRTLADDFETPTLLREFSTVEDDTGIFFTDDNLTMFISRGPGLGAIDIFTASRADVSMPFGPLSRVNISSALHEDYDPVVTSNGLELFWTQCVPSGACGIHYATRSSVSETAFVEAPAPAGLGSGDSANVTVTNDNRTIVYASRRPAGVGGYDLWYITRATSTSAWSTPSLVPSVNTVELESQPYIRPDGCELFFTRVVPGVTEGRLWVAPIL